jgi:ABC-type phosphate/phosphonate transport system substrate-binding protein
MHDLKSAVRALEDRKVAMMNMSGLEYLRIKDSTALVPSLVAVYLGNRVYSEFVLLGRREKWRNLEELRGKKIKIGAFEELSRMWLDVVLDRAGLPPSAGFFRVIEMEQKASKAILPVFFERVDACVVTVDAFETMAELNPQVGAQLTILARSQPMLPRLLCFRPDLDTEAKATLRDAALQLHTKPSGQQVLRLFRSERIVPFDEAHLDGISSLVAAFEALEIASPGEGL